MNTTTQTQIIPMSDRAAQALRFIAGVGDPPDGLPSEQATAFDELLQLGFVREMPDAIDGENPYPISEAGVIELAARREADRADAISQAEAAGEARERARCLGEVDAVMAVESRYVPRWASAEIRRRLLGEPAETLASRAAAVDRQAVGYYLLTGKRHSA